MSTEIIIKKTIPATEVQGWGRSSTGQRTSTFTVTAIDCTTLDGKNFSFRCYGMKGDRHVSTFFFSTDPKLYNIHRLLEEQVAVAWKFASAPWSMPAKEDVK